MPKTYETANLLRNTGAFSHFDFWLGTEFSEAGTEKEKRQLAVTLIVLADAWSTLVEETTKKSELNFYSNAACGVLNGVGTVLMRCIEQKAVSRFEAWAQIESVTKRHEAIRRWVFDEMEFSTVYPTEPEAD